MDLERPAPFLPPNARYSDLTAIGGRLYTSTSRECGGVANGVWAITLDPKNKTVSSWKTNGGSPVGNLAFTASGKILVAIGPGNNDSRWIRQRHRRTRRQDVAAGRLVHESVG